MCQGMTGQDNSWRHMDLSAFHLLFVSLVFSLSLSILESTLSHAGSTELCEFGAERSAMVVQLHPRAPSPGSTHVNHAAVPVPNHAPIMQDLQQQDSTSYVLLNLAKGEGIYSDAG